MPNLTDADRAYVDKFVRNVGEALEKCPNADASTQLLFDACKEVSGPGFIPLGTFDRLLRATGQERTDRRYGKRYTGLLPKDPAFHDRVWYRN
ncbi:hypothetical protein OIE62_11580 [Streptomyces scopuliridis]|uniref:Uncharacterized protein n=1 Tax=Streptomyces scopuliridis TaxID=452529 RepID=A0ACD4ZQM5_9ACTN|nr:hypothetical protein [Streptomyces scopuliridis]WSC00795.1 hypothetical protein OG835_29815 [Streptomyces scopuliridis]WSC05594.1 hypothetical protein OIE62_11580 [Streptomyces scopuliridis]